MTEQKIIDYIKGTLPADEISSVEAWCKECPENMKLLEQIFYVSFVDSCATSMSDIDLDKEFAEFKLRTNFDTDVDKKEKSTGFISFSYFFKKAALPFAAFFTGIALTMGLALMFLNHSSQCTFETGKNQRATCVLPDGSRVWLNSLSKLSYRTSLFSSKRMAELSGEGYFEVAKDPHSPFIVTAKDVDIEVLGTKFDIRAKSNEDRIIATLLQGSIKATDNSTNKSVILAPNDILIINTLNNEFTLTSSQTSQDILLWREGKLKFDQRSFGEIAKCLEQHFDVKFVFQDKNILDKKFTCNFNTDDSINDILSVLELTKHINIERNGNKVFVASK